MKKFTRREFLKTVAGTSSLLMIPSVFMGCGGSHSGGTDKLQGASADLHMHLQRQKIADRMIKILGQSEIYGRQIVESNAELLIAHLDRLGASSAFAFSAAYIWGSPLLETPEFPRLPPDEEYEEVKAENNWAAAQAAEYPDRLTAFFSVYPFADYALDEIERCKRDLNLSAMKLHFGGSRVSLQDADNLRDIKVVLAKAESLDIGVVIHFRNDEPDFGTKDAQIFIDEILAPCPNLRVQLAHMGGNGGFDSVTEGVFGRFIQAFNRNPALRRERLFFDLSFVILEKDQITPNGYLWREATTPEQCERLANMLRKWGIGNIFWGSDFFMADPSEYLAYMRGMLPLTVDEYNCIMNNTGKAFLKW